MKPESENLIPQPGDKTEVLFRGPFNGMTVRQTDQPIALMTTDYGWYAIYHRNNGRLEYIALISPSVLLSINTDMGKGM